jgi:beta-galactosidase
VAIWKREIPVGSGITGLWRPVPKSTEESGLLALLTGTDTTIFALQQNGSNLTGSVEGNGVNFFGGNDAPAPIAEGKVDSGNISFKAGNNTYTGTVKGDQIELQRSGGFGFRIPEPAKESADRPAIGPPPDGSDPSINTSWRRTSTAPIVLHRVQQ